VVTEDVRDVDLQVAKALVATLVRLAGGVRRPLLCDLRRVKTMHREARTYFSGPATEGWSATALVIDSPLTRAIANFFMGLNKPRAPTRMFASQDDAEPWLRSFVSA
jgi:hypothetical protein